MKKDYSKAVRDLEAFLADDGSMAKEDIRKELAEDGVDVQAFLSRFERSVRKGYQHQLKMATGREQAEAKETAGDMFGNLITKTWEELQRIFDDVRNGAFGDDLKGAALARCRNQVGDKVSESELRSWLQDIAAAIPK